MLRLVIAFVLSLLAVTAFAQMDPRERHPLPPELVVPRSTGPQANNRVVGTVQVGEHAPDFSLQAAGGAEFRLKQTRGHWTALFFTDRREDLPRLEGLTATLDSLKVTTIVVLDEKEQSLTQWKSTSHSSLTALADDRGEIASMYGLWDNQRSATRHGLFVLDPQGVVKLELLGQKVGGPSLRGLVQTAVEGL